MAYSDKEIVLVTGGNGGIGLEVARQLARDHGQRFYVLIGCRKLPAGEAAVKQLREEGIGDGVEAIQVDITSEESLAAAAKLVGDKFGRLDVLHANVSIHTNPNPRNFASEYPPGRNLRRQGVRGPAHRRDHHPYRSHQRRRRSRECRALRAAAVQGREPARRLHELWRRQPEARERLWLRQGLPGLLGEQGR